MHLLKAVQVIILTTATSVLASCQITLWACDKTYDCHIPGLTLCANTPQAAAAGFNYTEFEGYPWNFPNARIGYSFAVNQQQYAEGKVALDRAHPGDCTEHVYSDRICAPEREKVTVCGTTVV